MKRSLINKSIEWARGVLEQNNISLPEFAYWGYEEWQKNADDITTIRKTMLGWDVTDYGSGDFDKTGSVLFTVRNGDVGDKNVGTPYAEKYIVLKPGQAIPTHMHKTKAEDIISRCAASYCIKLYNTGKDGKPDLQSDVDVFCDGIKKTFPPGETIEVTNGTSMTLHPYLYHSFWGMEGGQAAVVGEVSSINDDNTDNYFAQQVARFMEIEEDEAPLCPLCNEYSKLLG
ncbi:D-lyxose/D-mannose family sugar isomerase [Christensenellaceae bacterium OttesenSCG-928-K19]|nr:D-lyxose/D-mannose family sugar isomerase [Christensenellaceae bacterium OttesenSCG-928-K19]